MKIINKIVSNIGRRIDESSPMVDARLPDGSRVNAIIGQHPPGWCSRSAASWLCASPWRRFWSPQVLTLEMAEVLKALVKAKLNIIISGGTGSGKTTLLNILATFLAPEERIVSIEDAAELQFSKKNVVGLETRPPNIEGKGEISQRDLVRNALRMRPDRIIVGEVRGPEVMDMFQAMNTGHEGSMTTIHANSPDALRLEAMVTLAAIRFRKRPIQPALLFVIIQLAASDGFAASFDI
jgi:pilus assembly protein CpaF